jgi:hypothetical protein
MSPGQQKTRPHGLGRSSLRVPRRWAEECGLTLHGERSASRLLDDMGDLVREQALTVGGVRPVLTVSEHHVVPNRERGGVDGAVCSSRACVGVDAHAAEIVTQAGFHPLAGRLVERVTGRIQGVLNQRRCGQSFLAPARRSERTDSRRCGAAGLPLGFRWASP